MKTIDIENQKKILKKAKKVLNCILTAKTRIEEQEVMQRNWSRVSFYTQNYCLKNIESHKAAIVKLESYYHKTISQL
jgi:hypothetical protein